jgi:hypothetical protein
VTAAELRRRGKRRPHPRLDAKVVVALAAAVLLIVVLFTVPSRHGGGRSGRSAAHSPLPTGWTAHSAYGIQIAAPDAWSVQVFGECPDGTKPGTLFIGLSRFTTFCPEYGSGTSQVAVSAVPPGTGSSAGSDETSGPARRIRVHGLSVVASDTGTELRWVIPSKQVTVTGQGPRALSIMQTLAPATPEAVPAAGMVTGSEELVALERVPVSGPVTVRRLGSATAAQVEALDGVFSFSGRPGRYVLTGHDGNSACAPVTVVVVSGTSTVAPPILCQGR